MNNELKKALLNESWIPFGKMPKEVQAAMAKKAMPWAKDGKAVIECLNIYGCWGKKSPREPFYKGLAYRVTTDSIPDDTPAYTDIAPVTHNGNLCVILDGIHVPLTFLAVGAYNCIGFVYDGKACPSLRLKPIDKSDPPTGFTIDPPQAVRFSK